MTSAVPISAIFTPGRQRLPRMIGAFVAVCLAMAGLTAQPAQAADTGKITGQVFTQTVGGTKTAATDVYIYLSYSATVDGGYGSVDSDPSTPRTDGYSFPTSTFELSGLKAGFYKFEVAGVADVSGVEFQREYYNNAESLGGATSIQVGTDTVTLSEMILEPAGQITGKVTDRAGNPLANASISFQDSERGGGGFATTDADGKFTSAKDPAERFGTGLVRGDYRVSARLDNYTNPDAPSYEERYWQNSATYTGATPVTVTPGATTDQIKIVLDVAPRIRLTVKDPAGTPLPNVNVGIYTFYDGAWGPYQAGPNTTDTDGIYRKTVRIGDRYKFFIAQPSGGAKWYGNTYSEVTATEVSASAYGQLFDLTIQLDPAPVPAPAVPKTLKTKKVSIAGTAKVGKKLRASTGAWGPAPVRKSYKWYRNGRTISGQKNSTYKLRKADAGKRITVRVTQTKAGYKSISKLSSKTKKVKKK